MTDATRDFPLYDLVNCFAEFKNRNGDPIDPATVSFWAKRPDGTQINLVYMTDAALVRDDEGKYRVGVDATMVGWWYYRFRSTGAAQAARKRAFRVVD